MSHVGTLFTGLLNKRFLKWAEQHNILTDAQFGFRFDVVNLYSNEYDLYINMSKTKFVIFRNRGNCKPEENWFLNGNHMNYVMSLCIWVYCSILMVNLYRLKKDCQIKEERQFLVYLIKYKMIVTTMKHFYHCLILM